MLNFVDLNGNDTPNIEEFVINKPMYEESKEDDLCVGSCDLGHTGSCRDKSGYFLVDNLFSELVTEYQKLLARRNLGISDDSVLKWGSIKGNLVNQSDLLNFVAEQLSKTTTDINHITDQKIINALQDLETAKLTTVYYGQSLDTLKFSTSMVITTDDYKGYTYILSPNRDTDFAVNGLKGGFEFQDITYINSKPFYIFKSDYPGLGITKITLSYGNSSE